MRQNNDLHTISPHFSISFNTAYRFIIPCIILLVFATFFFPIDTFPVYADEVTLSEGEKKLWENISQLIENLDVHALEEYFKNNNYFSAYDVKTLISELISGGNGEYGNIFSMVFSNVMKGSKELLPSFVVVIAISILCGALNSVKNSFLADSTTEIIFFACYASAILVLFFRLYAVFSLCSDCMEELKKQMEIVFPILLTLMAASGGGASASIFHPAVAFLCDGITSILTKVVLPVTMVIFILQMVSQLNKNIRLDGFVSLFKSTNKWILGVSVTVFGVFLSVQGLVSAGYDGISLRAAKYAISNTIPIVGNFISGGFDLVIAGNALIKNSVGLIGVFLIFSAIIKPIVALSSFNFLLRLSGAVCEPIGDKRISVFLTKTADTLTMLTAALFALAFLYFLTMIMIIFSAGAIFN